MRLLVWHCRRFEFKPVKKALREAKEIDLARKTFYNVLVVLSSVESDDDDSIINSVAEEIVSLMKDVEAERVLIYPYAHLSTDLATPHDAERMLKSIVEALDGRGVEVYMAPFGYYKEFVAEVFGHPLAERLRVITKETMEVRRVAGRKKYVIVTPDGKELDPSTTDLSAFDEQFRILVEKEALGVALAEKKHRMLESLKRFGFEWEHRSDFGHQRLNPNAALIFDLAIEYARNVARSVGIPIYEVKGTAFFNMNDNAVREHAVLYGDRLYRIRTDRGTFVLRYAACHQQFSMLADWYISYRNMPFGIFEVADSYRYEQSGEVELAFRLRRFWMPDLHVILRDEDEAWRMLLKIHDIIMGEAEKVGQKYELLVNIVSPEQYGRYKPLIKTIAERLGKPVLVAIYPPLGLSYYWTINIEYHIIDYLGRPREIGTVQIDVGNAARFGITYVDKDGAKKYPVIIHTAIIGTIERYVYMLFDSAMKMMVDGKKPMLPYWISPIQVRIIPIGENVMDYAKEVMEALLRHKVRVDMDDTNRTLSRKILDAEREWIPYIVAIGERELRENKITVRIRRTGEQRTMNLDEFLKILEEEQNGYPWRSLYVPQNLSVRIRYP